MVQKVTGFKTQDGKVFDTEALALAHEKSLLLGEAVEAELIKLGVVGALIYPNAPHDDGSTDLLGFLLDNSEALVIALTVPKKERKPRAPKEPVQQNKTLTEALTVVTTTLEKPVGALEESQTTLVAEPVNTEAGSAAEDELAALLGAEVAPSTEVAV